MWVHSVGWEDSLEEEMAPHSSILVWKIPWAEDPGGLQSMGSHKIGHDWAHTNEMWAPSVHKPNYISLLSSYTLVFCPTWGEGGLMSRDQLQRFCLAMTVFNGKKRKWREESQWIIEAGGRVLRISPSLTCSSDIILPAWSVCRIAKEAVGREN